MSDHEIKLDGQTWDLLALRSARSDNSLPALLDRARVGERLGPSAMLGLAACSTTSSLADARYVLRSDFGFDAARAKGAVAVGGLISSATVTNDPLGFVADVKMSPSQRNRVCGRLGGKPAADAVGDKLSVAAAMANWDSRKFRRFALDAARTNDPAVMGVSAAIGASMRRHDPQGFASRLTASQTYPLASGRNTKLAQRANDVLTAAYTMSSLDPSGLALGPRAWNDAPPTWRESAAPWVYAILDETNGAAVAHLLNAVHSRGLNFVQPGASPFHFLDSQQELTEARLRLQTFSGQLTKWFDRPMWFDGGAGQVQVLLTQDEDRYMYAWVGVNGMGLLVAFDLLDGVPYGPDVAGVRAALALAIGWYLDVSVSLRMSASGTHAVQRSAAGTVTTGARYVPLPSFVRHANSMNSGTKAPPRLHGVVAHVRTFTNGYKPSARARQNAPKRLQAGMQSNQTFVRAYMKGHGNLALLTTHLSKYSALADVIAGLQRRSG
ncbi:hypothetical protein ACOACQ_19155 [Nocardioides sp. CPCC 206347]|uniref:hypothetical protein n=1 Tax=unclassified Nocardioides TaxID=2615069 RepID=UPI003610112E